MGRCLPRARGMARLVAQAFSTLNEGPLHLEGHKRTTSGVPNFLKSCSDARLPLVYKGRLRTCEPAPGPLGLPPFLFPLSLAVLFKEFLLSCVCRSCTWSSPVRGSLACLRLNVPFVSSVDPSAGPCVAVLHLLLRFAFSNSFRVEGHLGRVHPEATRTLSWTFSHMAPACIRRCSLPFSFHFAKL